MTSHLFLACSDYCKERHAYLKTQTRNNHVLLDRRRRPGPGEEVALQPSPSLMARLTLSSCILLPPSQNADKASSSSSSIAATTTPLSSLGFFGKRGEIGGPAADYAAR